MSDYEISVLNRPVLIKIVKEQQEEIKSLQEENRLLKKDILFTCMECGKEFDYEQVNVIDFEGNVLCPYCNCGDISKEFIK